MKIKNPVKVENVFQGIVTTILGTLMIAGVTWKYLHPTPDFNLHWGYATAIGSVGLALVFAKDKIPTWMDIAFNGLLRLFIRRNTPPKN